MVVTQMGLTGYRYRFPLLGPPVPVLYVVTVYRTLAYPSII
jgi:hypothetical protein